MTTCAPSDFDECWMDGSKVGCYRQTDAGVRDEFRGFSLRSHQQHESPSTTTTPTKPTIPAARSKAAKRCNYQPNFLGPYHHPIRIQQGVFHCVFFIVNLSFQLFRSNRTDRTPCNATGPNWGFCKFSRIPGQFFLRHKNCRITSYVDTQRHQCVCLCVMCVHLCFPSFHPAKCIPVALTDPA